MPAIFSGDKKQDLISLLSTVGQSLRKGATKLSEGIDPMGIGLVTGALHSPERKAELAQMSTMQRFGSLPLAMAGTIKGQRPSMARRVHPDDLAEMADFTDYVTGVFKLGKDKAPVFEGGMRRLAEHYGINPNQGNRRLANDFLKILDQSDFLKPNPKQSYQIPQSKSEPIYLRKDGRYAGSKSQ